MKNAIVIYILLTLLTGCAMPPAKESSGKTFKEKMTLSELDDKSIKIALCEVKYDYSKFVIFLGIDESKLRYVPSSADGYPVFAYSDEGKILFIKVERDTKRIIDAFLAEP